MAAKLGIGILGAGPVTQAIHLPVLATLEDRFKVVSVMDINAEVAANVAARCGAKPQSDADAVIADPAVDVIAICSPNGFHAAQVIAACAAGKKAVLCEKPLATSRAETEAIRAAIARSGTSLVVGTMHAYDPAYNAAQQAWTQTGDDASLIQSSIYLPTNDHFVDQATNQKAGAPMQRGGGSGPEFEAQMFTAAMLGLAIHNIPLIRDFYPAPGTVQSARYVKPFGYSLVLGDGRRSVSLKALMPGAWPPKWQLRIFGRDHRLEVQFPPSYVLAGSAVAQVHGPGGSQTFAFAESGYQAQWKHLYDAVEHDAALRVPLDTAIADIDFALTLAEQGAQTIRSAA